MDCSIIAKVIYVQNRYYMSCLVNYPLAVFSSQFFIIISNLKILV
jgi:hypothetical protein